MDEVLSYNVRTLLGIGLVLFTVYLIVNILTSADPIFIIGTVLDVFLIYILYEISALKAKTERIYRKSH
jgi:hypothetical protein